MMSKPLTIVAIFRARPGHEHSLEASLRALVAPTLAESGCLNYDLHRSTQETGVFLFYENWETREQWLDHMESAHLKAHQARTEGMVADFQLLEMEMLPVMK
jgi:quinol monooxygenase YgiN